MQSNKIKKIDEIEKIKIENFSKKEKENNFKIITLENKYVKVKMTNYGATLVEFWNKKNNTNIVLGYSSVEDYQKDNFYLGSSVGRVAGRIFSDKVKIGKEYFPISTNDGDIQLHGGFEGFNKKTWTYKTEENKNSISVKFFYTSKDMEEGFPGELKVECEYKIIKNKLKITYKAYTNKKTVVNLTNHSYFNLNGIGSGTIMEHQAKFKANKYLKIDNSLKPTGEIASVKNTFLDFLKPTKLSKSKQEYDNYLICSNSKNKLKKVAEIVADKTDNKLKYYTNQKGFVFYSGNFLDGRDLIKGKAERQSGFCLESSGYINAQANSNFPKYELEPNKEYKNETVFEII